MQHKKNQKIINLSKSMHKTIIHYVHWMSVKVHLKRMQTEVQLKCNSFQKWNHLDHLAFSLSFFQNTVAVDRSLELTNCVTSLTAGIQNGCCVEMSETFFLSFVQNTVVFELTKFVAKFTGGIQSVCCIKMRVCERWSLPETTKPSVSKECRDQSLK